MDCSAGRSGIGGLAAALLWVGPSEKNSIECKYNEDCINHDEKVKVFWVFYKCCIALVCFQ